MKREDALARLDDSFRPLVVQFLNALDAAHIAVFITSARRTLHEQQTMYAQGRTMPGVIVTNAKAGESAHNYGAAIDICPVRDGRLWWDAPVMVWQKIGMIGEKCGLVWGGNFKSMTDRPHFEAPGWRSLRDQWRQGKLVLE